MYERNETKLNELYNNYERIYNRNIWMNEEDAFEVPNSPISLINIIRKQIKK